MKKSGLFTISTLFIILITVICISGCVCKSENLTEDASMQGVATEGASTEGASAVETSGDGDVLYQVSTLDALLMGVYDGVLSFEELEKHGDFGIGTCDGLEGEMLAVDGKYYQIKIDGIAYVVSEDMTTPFATVTSFEADETFHVEGPMNFSEFEQYLDQKLPSENLFYAVRVDGNFSFLKARSVPKQEKPYPALADAISSQAVFEFENVSGTLVGFRTPEYVKGVNVPGYHLHFITTDRNAGGHVLEFELEDGDTAVDITRAFFMELPAGGDFYDVELGQDHQAEVEIVEK